MYFHVLAFLSVLLELIFQLQGIGFPCWKLINFCNLQNISDKSLIRILFLLSTCNGNTLFIQTILQYAYPIKLVKQIFNTFLCDSITITPADCE